MYVAEQRMQECIDGKSSHRVRYPARILESLIISAFLLSELVLRATRH